MDYQVAVKVSAGFGGGMYLGSVCGAVTGGIMAIGLKHGGLGPTSMQTAILARDFADRFKAQHKSINCPDLTGFDLSKIDIRNPEILKKLFKGLDVELATDYRLMQTFSAGYYQFSPDGSHILAHVGSSNEKPGPMAPSV